MLRRQKLLSSITPLVVIASLSFVSNPKVTGQDVQPGAIPAWTTGDPNAAVSVEVFNDYQCPPCAKMNEELKKIDAEYQGRVLLIFRNFPLTPVHKNALSAAQAAEAAGLQGKFIEMINLLYDKREQWHDSDDAKQLFTSYDRALNLDVEKFASDMQGDLISERIQLDLKRAKSLGVKGTPTVFVNGKDAGLPIENMHRAIKEALGETKL